MKNGLVVAAPSPCNVFNPLDTLSEKRIIGIDCNTYDVENDAHLDTEDLFDSLCLKIDVRLSLLSLTKTLLRFASYIDQDEVLRSTAHNEYRFATISWYRTNGHISDPILQAKKPTQPQILDQPTLNPYRAMLWIGSYGCGKFTVSKVIAEYIGFQVFEINWAEVSQCNISNTEIEIILNTVHKNFVQSLVGESKRKAENQDRPASSSMDIYAAKIVIAFQQLLARALERSVFMRTKKMIVIRNLEEIFDAIQNRLFVDLLMRHIQTTLLSGGFVDVIPIFIANNEDHFRIRELKTLIKSRHDRMSLLYDAYCKNYLKEADDARITSIEISMKTLHRNCSYSMKKKIMSTLMDQRQKLWSHAILKFKPPDVSERRLFVQRQFSQESSLSALPILPLTQSRSFADNTLNSDASVSPHVYWKVPKIARSFISVDRFQFPPCRVAVDFANSGDMRQMFIQMELNERNLRSLNLDNEGHVQNDTLGDQVVDSEAFMYTDEMLNGTLGTVASNAIKNHTLHTTSSYYKKPITNLFDACHFILRDSSLLNHITNYSRFVFDSNRGSATDSLHSSKIVVPIPIYIPPN